MMLLVECCWRFRRSYWKQDLVTMFTDLKLAERLEEVEAFAAGAYVRRLARRRPGIDIAAEEVAGGLAVFVGAGSPLSETKALGLHGPVTDLDLDRMENVFFSRGEPSRVVVCPLADPTLVAGLGRRGYRLSHFENMLCMPLDSGDRETPSTTGIEVRPVGPDEADLYARVVGPNFVEPGEPAEEIIDMALTMLGAEGSVSFLAWIDGQAVGGGAVIVHRGLALFAGAATLPPFRNRGVHAALHHVRLAYARQSGCDLAAQGAQPGSTSQRNAERRGLRVAYTRALLIREPI
jgi:GNAT superfamily N-acetyltransferase